MSAFQDKKMVIENIKILNLGCGNRIIINAINHDLVQHRSEVDIVWDLNKMPWPWSDNSFDRIEAISVFEHLRFNLLDSINECWRILRAGGILKVKLPFWNHENCWADPTHTRGYCLKVFDFFDPAQQFGKEYNFYTNRKWKIIERGFATRINSSIYGVLKAVK